MIRLNVLNAIILWLVVTTGGSLLLLPYDRKNPIIILMLFFNNLNILIAMCEIILGLRIQTIKDDYKENMKKYDGKEWKCGLDFLLMPLPNPICSKSWSKMWSTYAVYDPSYQNNESFGFFIDVGNGWSTIPPCLLWNYAMAYPNSCSALLVGCVGIASYWQVCYGTIIYLLSYMWNKRYQGKSVLENLGFVGFANMLWFWFPLIGIYASVCILKDGNFSVFQR
jgi:hypothetical protein